MVNIGLGRVEKRYPPRPIRGYELELRLEPKAVLQSSPMWCLTGTPELLT